MQLFGAHVPSKKIRDDGSDGLDSFVGSVVAFAAQQTMLG